MVYYFGVPARQPLRNLPYIYVYTYLGVQTFLTVQILWTTKHLLCEMHFLCEMWSDRWKSDGHHVATLAHPGWAKMAPGRIRCDDVAVSLWSCCRAYLVSTVVAGLIWSAHGQMIQQVVPSTKLVVNHIQCSCTPTVSEDPASLSAPALSPKAVGLHESTSGWCCNTHYMLWTKCWHSTNKIQWDFMWNCTLYSSVHCTVVHTVYLWLPCTQYCTVHTTVHCTIQ